MILQRLSRPSSVTKVVVGTVLTLVAATSIGIASASRPVVDSGTVAQTEQAAPGAQVLSGIGVPILESGRGALTLDPVEQPWIHLGSGYEFNPHFGDPTLELEPEWRAADVAPGTQGYYLVQFDGPITDEDRARLSVHGATIVSYIPDYAFLVGMNSEQRSRVAAAPSVVWTEQFQPAWKISTQPEMQQPGPRDMLILLFPDQDMTAVAAEITAKGGAVLDRSDNGINKLVKVSLDTADLASYAQINGIAWIEPFHVPQWHNSSCQWVVQTNTNNNRHVWDKNLKGQGQIINVVDTGLRVTHNQFRDPAVPLPTFGHFPTHRKVISYQRTVTSINIVFGDESINSYHGTHTSGTAAGDDSPNAADQRDGMAINAKIYFNDGGGAPDPGVIIPLDLNDLFIMPYTGNAAGAARVSTNSWGNDVGGAYDIQSMASDQFMWAHPDFLIFFSNGNAGGVNTVGSPATAKSVASIGGTGNGASSNVIYSSTSRGPTDDGRFKPTFSAPATVASALGSGDTGYTTLSGTSMASPAAAGATVLIRQYLTDGWYPTGAPVVGNAFTPSAALMKSMALNSADPNVGSFVIPDNNIGWGRIDIDNVLPFSDDTSPQRRLALVDDTDGILTAEFVEYQVYVAANTIPLKASLVWTDYPGTPASSVQLVNNLNLVATDPGGTIYRGNVYSGGQSTTGGVADTKNVEECVQRNAPATGVWTFRIEGSNVPIGPQPFALVITGALGSDQGLVVLDQTTYSGADLVGIRVVDTNAGATVTVQVDSDTDGGESVVLNGSNGVYEGSIQLSLNYPNAGDGDLQVSDGDEITVTYLDANPVATLVGMATVNTSGPAISNVRASAINESDASIAWDTSSPSNSRVHYGTTPALGSSTPVDGTLVQAHTVMLTGLVPNSTYYYDVESFDSQGNGVRDDNGGLHYIVSTDQNRDVLVVLGDDTFTKKQSYINALNRHGWTYTIWEGGQAAVPYVGDLVSGMASYKAVIWQTGLEQYPAFTDAALDSVTKLHSLGSRTALYSNDMAWDFCDPASTDDTAERCAFVQNEWKITFQADPLTFSSVRGLAGDPISGSYVGGIPYTPHREGAACDEINGIATGGTFANVWRNNDATADDIAIRWTASGNIGDPLRAVWGGTPRKVSTNCFEWAQLNVGNADDVTRADVLDKTLIWLIGHDHPTAGVTAPNGGENLTGSSVNITWTEAVDSGFTVASRKLYYSSNSGDSWTLITASAPPSPFVWNITSIPNGAQYRVRVVISDNGSPALSAIDGSNANFSINRAGGDTRGPVVLAGSVASDPNPIISFDPATVTATVSDVYTGNANIAAAEWSFGGSPAPAGSGTAMSGAFSTPLVNVSVVVPGNTLPSGVTQIWVRGRDVNGNWGNASSMSVQVNSVTGIGEGSIPVQFALGANMPNPFHPETAIRYDIPSTSRVRIEVFDLSGRLVRTLLDGEVAPGSHRALWNAMDDQGHTVGSGVYFYRMQAGSFESTRKMVLLK